MYYCLLSSKINFEVSAERIYAGVIRLPVQLRTFRNWNITQFHYSLSFFLYFCLSQSYRTGTRYVKWKLKSFYIFKWTRIWQISQRSNLTTDDIYFAQEGQMS